MTSSANRRPANVSLDARLVADAKSLGVNVSRACEAGLVVELKKVREANWLDENREAITGYNAWIERNGVPFADRRKF